MNISSILITIVGIIIILALYVLSRLGQRNLPKKNEAVIREIKDSDGELFTSVLDDIPATDKSSKQHAKTIATESQSKKQIIVFISAQDDQGLDGSLIKQALINNGLVLGDKDIYHYFDAKNEQSNSLFRVANGVEPWTLRDQDLIDQRVLGISMVMLFNDSNEHKSLCELFMNTADSIAQQSNGVLKNRQQEILSHEDRISILES